MRTAVQGKLFVQPHQLSHTAVLMADDMRELSLRGDFTVTCVQRNAYGL